MECGRLARIRRTSRPAVSVIGRDARSLRAGRPHSNGGRMFERFASWATRWTGSTTAFILAAASIVVWIVTGPMFHWSDTWQLVANTFTTIVTFLMVFLIQRTQNK